tara:strand:+ start:179 stop:487 length:309 start_codon:yes stop_codon:yes gene_type:complete
MIKFVEVINTSVFDELERRSAPHFQLGEVWINPDSVVKVESNPDYRRLLERGLLPEGLQPTHEFSRITLQEGNTSSCCIVVGDASNVASKLMWTPKRQLLKG